jgi:hypothetical protein
MSEHYHQLKKLIENYVHDEKPIYNGFDKTEIVGYTLSASSFIRKQYTMNKIKNLISKLNLDLIIFEDKTMEMSDRFIIAKKEYNVQQH